MTGLGIAAVGGVGAVGYVASPFWKRIRDDMGREIKAATHQPDPSKWPDTGVHAAWLGHSTVLLKIDGTTVITDPVLSGYAGIDLWVGTIGIKRLVHPALRVERLPKVDLILLSHAHMDHFNLATLRMLEGKDTRVVTASNTSDLLRVDGYREVVELGWGQSTQAGPLRVQAFQVKHWGARLRSDTWRGYNGYVIEAGRWRVMFGGDTAFTPLFTEVRTSRPIDLAIMPIGAYNPWIRAHCNPEQAIKMLNMAGVESIIPVHHKTFRLSYEPVGEPLERLLAAAGSATDRVMVHDIGQEAHLT